jgi:predicted dehydrogenase
MASAALRAGKHVVCEKPTALNATEAEQLVTVAAAHPDKIAIIDHELRFVPSWRTARERIRELLPLRYIEMRYATSSRSARDRPWNWWSDAAQGGGAWGAFGSHFVDAIRYLGFEIEAAQAVLHTFIDRRPFESELREVTSDDFAAVQLRICGGALADLTFSAVAAGPEEASIVTIHAEKGAVRLTGQELFVATPQDPWTRVEGDVNLADNSAGGAFGRGIYELGCALRVALDHGDRSALAPAATFEDGLAQQRVLDAARRSAAQEGRWEGV